MSDSNFIKSFFMKSLDSDNYYLENTDIFKPDNKFEERDLSLYHIKEITFEEKAPRKEAFENVLSAMRVEGVNIIYLIRGDRGGVHFYFGVSKNLYAKDTETPLVLHDIGDDILEPSLKGNFRGCEVEKVRPDEKESIINSINNMRHYSVLHGVPGVIEDNEKFQGVDRLVDIMLGDEFGIMIIATPLNRKEIKQIENNLYSLYAAIAPLARVSMQKGTSTGTGSTTSSTKGFSSTDSISESSSKTETRGESDTETSGTSSTTTNSQSSTLGSSSSHAETRGKNDSRTTGSSASTNMGSGTNKSSSRSVGNSTSRNNSSSSSSESSSGRSSSKSSGSSSGRSSSNSHSEGSSTSYSETKGSSNSSTWGESSSKSNTRGTSESKSDSYGTSTGENKGKSHAVSSSTGTSDSEGSSHSYSQTKSDSDGTSSNESSSLSATVDFVDKKFQDWIKYVDEVITPRLDYGKGKGIFVSSAFLFSNNKGSMIKLENTMKSLYAGDKGNNVPLKSFGLRLGEASLDIYKQFQLPRGTLKFSSSKDDICNCHTLLSQYVSPTDEIIMGNWISTNELGLIAGLPQKEIVGLGLREEVDFGLNTKSKIKEPDKLELGNLVQSGQTLEFVPVYLDKSVLDKHIFIAGVTGSGKTTTCQKLLIQSELPFLVIEPAKTEYRILTERYDDILIFTLGKDSVAPFRLNPFEFYPHESITSHIDMIKASLEASFDMEAAIPQIIEASIYECYEDYGWNIASNKNLKIENPFDPGVYSFPTLGDLVEKIDFVVGKQGFDERLKKDYIGSIKARLQSLLIGSKGLMLNTPRSVNLEKLLDRRVIFEIEEIRNPSEKSLIMGFILANLNEALKIKFNKNIGFRHITLIEEAHRLLSKFSPGDSPNKKQGVESFADMLAEVRKYGESLIIVDQIPNKLTPEVLKNTNTKIVHRIFAQDDKDAIGNTMVLTDEQKKFLSNLETGRAVILTRGWSKAMQVQITKITDTTGHLPIDEEQIRSRIVDFYCRDYKSGVIQGLESFSDVPSREDFEKLTEFIAESRIFKEYVRCINEAQVTEDMEKKIKEGTEKYAYSLSFLAECIARNLYMEDVEVKKEYIERLFNNILSGNITIGNKTENILRRGMRGRG